MAGLEQQLASAQPVRESEALRERSGELETVKQALAARRSLTANSQASREAQLEAERAVTAAHAAKAEALLNATERALEVRIEVAVQERQQAEESLEELASLSRAAALRLYQERLALVHADRARLVAESVAAGPRPAEGPPSTSRSGTRWRGASSRETRSRTRSWSNTKPVSRASAPSSSSRRARSSTSYPRLPTTSRLTPTGCARKLGAH